MSEAAVRTHRFTTEAFHQMGEAGILPPDGRFELIGGEIVEMSPIGSAHAAVVSYLNRLLMRQVGNNALVWVQNPLRLDELHEPQPDLALLRPRADDYAARLPAPDDCLLVIEVADTSLAYDRDTKTPLYGAAGVPEVWLVDLEGRHVLRYTNPAASGYRDRHRAEPPEELKPAVLPDVAVALDHLFPA
jgi:Uma2 family endonuclease